MKLDSLQGDLLSICYAYVLLLPGIQKSPQLRTKPLVLCRSDGHWAEEIAQKAMHALWSKSTGLHMTRNRPWTTEHAL